MDKDTITLQEVGNDGRSVFLYYDAMAGVYLAFGLSAYYTTMGRWWSIRRDSIIVSSYARP